MQEKQYGEAKKEIRSVLLTYKESVSLEEFLKTYRGLVGQRLPSQALGYSSDVAFLQSMPDVVDLTTDSCGKMHLMGIADKTSKHIQNLVLKQRKSKPNSKQVKKRQPVRKLPDTSLNVRSLNIRESKPFLPGALKAELLQLMSTYSSGVSLTALALAYRRKFNKYLPLVKGLDTLEEMINMIPELEVRNENNERIAYHRRPLNSIENKEENSRKYNESSVEKTKVCGKEDILGKKWSNIHESGIADDILKEFQMLLEKCPDGILDLHFPLLYENVTGKSFDLHDLGYNSLVDLVDALPLICKRIPYPENERQWLILPAKSSVKYCSEGEQTPRSKKQSPYQFREGIPADASPPVLQYIQPTIPDYVNLNEYVPVYVSAIVNPSIFWFQLQIDENIEMLQKLEKDMGYFYNTSASNEYRMKNADIAIGAACVVQCPNDYQWYRAVVKSIPSTDLVNVLFVDYGGRENVPRDNVYYVWSKYHEYPACAFKGELAGLKLPGNVPSWRADAIRRFIQLCDCPMLMAYLKTFDKDTFSIYLCNTSGDTDIHLNDTLVYEGYAEFCSEAQFDMKSDCSDKPKTKSDGEMLVHFESDYFSESEAFAARSDDSGVNSESNNLPINKKLSFSPKVSNNNVQPCSSVFKKGKSKRYVKLLELCEETKICIINLENKLYMSCGHLCKLLWSEKNSDFLIERLMYKDITIPFLNLKKEDHTELFMQCEWYKIPDFDEFDSIDSTLMLCPLEEAFKVLNIFGHPSLCLRLAIQNEIKRFDPLDTFWSEFSYKESCDWENIEEDIKQKLNKLCLYDLKAKTETLRIKKLKLLRINSAPSNEELKKVENLQNLIEARMKQIEAICSQYASCS